jgi:hypothetical protein
MAYGTSTVAGGTTGTLSDVPVAQDTSGGAVFQRTKDTDGTEGSTTAIGIDSNPKRVRPRRRGTADYDSGVFAVDGADPIVPGVVTAATIYPESGVLINDSQQVREVRWTNSAGGLLGVATIQPKQAVQMPLPASGAWVGLKIGASGDSVRAQIAGAQ